MQNRPRLYTNDKATSEGFSSGSRFVVFLVFVGISSLVWLFLGIKTDEIKPFEFHVQIDKNIRDADIVLSDTIIRIEKGKLLSVERWRQLEKQKNTSIIIVGTEMPDSKTFIDAKELISKRFSMKAEDDFSVFPAQIYYQKVYLQEKVVRLNLQNSILPKDGWEVLGEAKFEFQKLVIRGEKEIVQNITSLDVEAQWINPEYGEQELTLLIQKPKGIYMDKKWVSVRFKAEPFVLKKMLLPIRVPDFKGELRLLPSQLEVEVRIPLSLVNTVKEKDFLLSVDTSQIGKGQYLETRLIKCPKNVKFLQTKPSKVEYILIQK